MSEGALPGKSRHAFARQTAGIRADHGKEYHAMPQTENDPRSLSTSALIRRFMPYYRKYLPTLLFDLFCASMTTVCASPNNLQNFMVFIVYSIPRFYRLVQPNAGPYA